MLSNYDKIDHGNNDVTYRLQIEKTFALTPDDAFIAESADEVN
jgi:hypothetical protein